MPESIRLYLDEDTINRRLVRALRSRELDVLTANEAGLVQVPDQEHLNYATSLNRVVFTFNTCDFAALHADYVATARHYVGVIVSNQAQFGVILHRLLKLLNSLSADDMRDWLKYLSNWQWSAPL